MGALIGEKLILENKMTREEFYEKYKDVEFKLNGYNKYVFTFVGEYEGENVVVEVGGNSDNIYYEDFSVSITETVSTLQPFSGMCGKDSFYDY